MVTYHLMPRGVPDAKTRLQATALNQVIARFLQEGRLAPHAVAGLVFPREGHGAPPSSPRHLLSTTLGVSPERTSGHHTLPLTTADGSTSPTSRAATHPSSYVPNLPSTAAPTPLPQRSFPSTPSPSSSNSHRPTLPSSHSLAAATLDSFTLCLWFRVTYLGEFSILLSYSTHAGTEDALTLGPRLKIFVMEYKGHRVEVVQRYVEPQRWYSACVLRNGTDGRASLFLDGTKRLDMDAPTRLDLNGTLVLGNDQDYPGGGFNARQSVPGSVTGLYLWPRMLSLPEVSAVGDCDPPEASLLTWEAIPWQVEGEVQKGLANPCSQRSANTHFLLPVKITFPMARWFCSGHGLALPLPTSEAENDEILSYITNATCCVNDYNANPMVWLDVTYDTTAQQWLSGPKKLPIIYSQVWTTSGRTKMHSLVITRTGEWMPTEIMASSPLPNDSFGFLSWIENSGTSYGFDRGFPGSDPRTGGTGKSRLGPWPGSTPDQCLKKLVVQVRFGCDARSSLGPNSSPALSFQNWGSRANLRCPHSDSPISERGHSECANPCSVRKVEVSHILSGTIPRSFSFPPIETPNPIFGPWCFPWSRALADPHGIRARPSSAFRSSPQVQDQERLAGEVPPRIRLFVRKMSPGLDVLTGSGGHMIVSGSVADYKYSGAENELEYSLEFESNVHCDLNLELYPFDSQRCAITITVTNVIDKAVRYPSPPLHLAHPHVPSHPEFTVTSLTLSLQNKSTTALLRFCLHRRPVHHLFSTFFPTVLLHAIGYASFFLPLDNFQDRSVMSLTTLLALVALYSESLAALPSTSYLKHVDIWFVFSIAFLTTIVIAHLLINGHNTPLIPLPKNPYFPPPGLWQRLVGKFSNRSTDWKRMAGAKVLLGLTYMIFQAIFWIHVLVSMQG
ncbi:Gamma-aminobutyric acid receptor subunit beta-like [Chionoecetes opilio]|uniref:Gamma-aminobutyric acid receptor subunit beta-like n=1 Tax=Chionoecetes opilio TaxID=41210 RepID=A0A8J4YP52_CHIOP|nr:Gamma-aminobutyric acid receptor subunit beta-like [Chionoecetes opilio]